MRNRWTLAVVTGLLGAGLLAPAGLAADPPKRTIRQRQGNQQDRIAQGVGSGQLTPHETAKLERKEGAVNKEIHQDRQENGGKLTPQERRQVTRQQNRLSRQIYRQKHDAQTFPPAK